MMIVNDGRFASPAAGPQIERLIDRIGDTVSASLPLMAAAAARMASRFPGAIFRPESLGADDVMPWAADPVRAANALAMMAASFPEDSGEAVCERGVFRIEVERTPIPGLILTPAVLISSKLTDDGLAILVNRMTERCESYCVMGSRPETEAFPIAMDLAIAAIGTDEVAAEIRIPAIICENDEIEIRDVMISFDLFPDFGPSIEP